MRRGWIGGVVLVIVLASCSWSHTFLDLGVGSEVFGGSARCLGMGEVGLLCEETPFAVIRNPATLGMLAGPEVMGSYRFFSLEEDWSFPTHDSFDALLGYTTYSRNSNLYHSGAIGVCSGPIAQAAGIGLAMTFAPAYDFRYDFYEEVRDRSTSSVPSDKVIAEAFVEGDGDIQSLSFGAGGSAGPGVLVGVSLDYLFGDFDLAGRLANVDTTKLYCWERSGTEASDSFTSSELGGVRYRIGMRYKVHTRVEVAASMTTGCTLDGDYTTTSSDGLLGFLPRRDGTGGEFELEYPASYALGITFRPRNQLLTVIEANVRLTEWSNADNGALQGLDLDDTYQWNIGVEHVFYNDRPLRFGFIYTQSPVDEETGEAAVTVGSAINVADFDISFSGRVGWREYRYFDLFDDSIFCTEPREFTDLVEETSFSGLISISRRL
jgi:hypothetical protein